MQAGLGAAADGHVAAAGGDQAGAAGTAWVPAAQAVTMVSDGPCQPARIEMLAAPALAIIMGTRNGDTRRAPRSL